MRTVIKQSLTGLSLLLVMLTGCQEQTNTTSLLNESKTGSGQIYQVDQEGGQGDFVYTHDIGSSPRDVYFILTNIGLSDISSPTSITANQSSNHALSLEPLVPENEANLDEFDLVEYAKKHGIGLRGIPGINDLIIDPSQLDLATINKSMRPLSQSVSFAIVGQTDSLFAIKNNSTIYTVPATVRKVDSSGDITLNIWVENASYAADASGDAGCVKTHCITPTMITAFSESFSKNGASNDIYDWVTNIYGVPWGTHSDSTLIDPSAGTQIDILFLDIDEDNSTTGGVLGYYWSGDNKKIAYQSYSNQRLIFYMDSVLSATPDEDVSWDVNGYWPSELISTLAHEFQHMIHFYQKKTKNQLSEYSDTWLNEMASLVTEDLVADKLSVDGPRGVDSTDYSAGSAANESGRLPWFNSRNYYGLTDWYDYPYVFYSYASSYAFGAYLARNFGGPELFRNIIQNDKNDHEAVEQAVAAMGYNLSFGELLRKWGVAVLLSDTIGNPANYIYNSGASFDSTYDGVQYKLGSINLFDYSPEPTIFTMSTYTLGGHYKTSNTYIKVGSGLTGSPSWNIDMPGNVKLTVVTKPP